MDDNSLSHVLTRTDWSHGIGDGQLELNMQYAQKIILHAPPWHSPKLEAFVEKCIRDSVVLVCVIGNDCARVEDVIDELVVGDGSDPSRFLNTTSHPNESIAEVQAFAEAWTLDVGPTSPAQEVRL
ncbi:MAG TPA: hypothetical protein VMM15_21900 [Bradyrhizobium sp.]|nr:hypothetical protein [Bradyrhizobium sp.]